MQPKLMELKQELAWEYAIFGDKLKQVQTKINELETECKAKPLAETEITFPAGGLPQTELQELLGEQTYLIERLGILENKLKKIAALE